MDTSQGVIGVLVSSIPVGRPRVGSVPSDLNDLCSVGSGSNPHISLGNNSSQNLFVNFTSDMRDTVTEGDRSGSEVTLCNDTSPNNSPPKNQTSHHHATANTFGHLHHHHHNHHHQQQQQQQSQQHHSLVVNLTNTLHTNTTQVQQQYQHNNSLVVKNATTTNISANNGGGPQISRTLSQSLPSSRRSSFKEKRKGPMPQDSGNSLEDEFEKYFRMARLHEALSIVENQQKQQQRKQQQEQQQAKQNVPSITETKYPNDTDMTSLSSFESETSLERTASLNSSLARRKNGGHAWRKSDSGRRRQLRRSFHVKCPPNSVASKARQLRAEDDCDVANRPRVSTLPSRPDEQNNKNKQPAERPPHIKLLKPSVDLKQVRHYVITSKGLQKDDNSLPSPCKEKLGSGTRERIMVQAVTPDEFPTTARCHRVLLLGRSGVGKRALVREFMMPDHFFMSSADDDSEKYVSILLDGEESTLEFVDLSDQELDNGVPAGENIDAYVVVYSVEDSKSFQTALDRLGEIREDEGREVAVILVANKSDLVRTRVIFEEEGKNAAKKYDCKYIEVSAAIDHKIDELLVGILKQIRLINDKYNKRRSKVSSIVHHVTGKGGDCCPMGSSQSMLGKIFGKPRMTSKSCDNLYVL